MTDKIVIQIADVELTFAVEIHEDADHGAPWDECEGHGPVTGWVTRPKRGGELVLNTGRNSKRYYDFSEACKIALRDGWDHIASKPQDEGLENRYGVDGAMRPDDPDGPEFQGDGEYPPFVVFDVEGQQNLPGHYGTRAEAEAARLRVISNKLETKRQKAARAAMADFEYLRSWCNNDWSYVGIEVTLLDSEGNKTEVSDSLWGVESGTDEVKYQAETIADELAHGLHTRFEQVVSEVVSYKVL